MDSRWRSTCATRCASFDSASVGMARRHPHGGGLTTRRPHPDMGWSEIARRGVAPNPAGDSDGDAVRAPRPSAIRTGSARTTDRVGAGSLRRVTARRCLQARWHERIWASDTATEMRGSRHASPPALSHRPCAAQFPRGAGLFRSAALGRRPREQREVAVDRAAGARLRRTPTSYRRRDSSTCGITLAMRSRSSATSTGFGTCSRNPAVSTRSRSSTDECAVTAIAGIS
jgi:hypothetical protein